MSRRLRAAAAAPLALLSVAVLGACESTIAPEATAPSGSTPTATLYVATGTTTELLASLLDDSRRLSETIVENKGDSELLSRIDVTWEAAAPGVEEVAPQLVDDFERAIEMMRTGVTRRRPADADKASRNLEVLIAQLES